LLFVFNGVFLYHLTKQLTNQENIAFVATVAYSWSPASIFFSALYSESIYLMLSFLGMLVLYRRSNAPINRIFSVFMFAFAYLARANGILNFGFVAFRNAEYIASLITNKPYPTLEITFNVVYEGLFLFLEYMIFILPVKFFEWNTLQKFCPISLTQFCSSNSRISELFLSPNKCFYPNETDDLPWCRSYSFITPVPCYYSHIQQKFWGVRLFGHWHIRKLPFFLIASPTLALNFYGSYDVLKSVLIHKPLISTLFLNKLFPFAIHSLFISCSAIFVYNVEVITRLTFASTPFIYITIARMIVKKSPTTFSFDNISLYKFFGFRSLSISNMFVLLYVLLYCFIGAISHSNWLPYI